MDSEQATGLQGGEDYNVDTSVCAMLCRYVRAFHCVLNGVNGSPNVHVSGGCGTFRSHMRLAVDVLTALSHRHKVPTINP